MTDHHRTVKSVVMGDIDLVRPLGLAGLRSVVVASPKDIVLSSKYTDRNSSWEHAWEDTEERSQLLLASLMRFGAAQSEPPVLYYQWDEGLLLLARHKEQLSQVFRFVLPEPALVEDLVDKARFQELAIRLDLPVPSAQRVHSSFGQASAFDLHFPVIVKPVRNRTAWQNVGGNGKALLIDSAKKLEELWRRIGMVDIDLLIQEAIPGSENRIESYHVYVDQLGAIVAEFTGRKVRTLPSICGNSTAVETTDEPDVRVLGREIVQKLGLRGVAKLDFKRGLDGRLYLLEVNPRFNLWHHLGAVAGVNFPAIVYADLVGLPRPGGKIARAGVSYCKLWSDRRAAKEIGSSLTSWLWWALRCKVKSGMAWDDPMPFARWALSKLPRRLGGDSSLPNEVSSDFGTCRQHNSI